MRAPLITIVVVAVIGVAAYVFFGDRTLPGGPVQQTAGPAAATAGGASSGSGDDSIDKEAEKYISKLTEPDTDPVAVEKADHFVTKDQQLSLLPDDAMEETTPEKLAADPDLAPDTPITVVKKAEQIEMTTPEKIIAESEGDLDRPVRVLEGGEVKESTPRELLEQYRQDPDTQIAVIKDVEYFEITTPKELLEDPSIKADQTIKIIRTPYRLEAATLADLMQQQGFPADTVFYVRTVRPTDEQGIWGIVHDGLIENFARGMAIRRGEEINTYQVEIPRHADERLPDQSSSFLGKMIFGKTMQSYVYNFKQNRMGRNPDRVIPGQEIVIISFQPEELIQIYRHFAGQQS